MIKPWSDLDLSSLDTPALLIDRDMVEYNIQLAIKYAGSTQRLRPHVKTHKLLEVAKMQIAAGIYQFKCATIAEAEMLGMAGAKDVLIAYPVQGPKINRVLALIQQFPETHYSILIDNFETAQLVNTVFKNADQNITVFIDANNGQDRTGVMLKDIPQLVTDCMDLSQVKIIGLHCYDGHIRMASLAERTAACRKAFEVVIALRDVVGAALNRAISIVAGGSPSFSVHAEHHDVVCSPGTFIFWDERYGGDYQEQEFKKAAVLATRVISKLNAYTYCLDLGHKSVASEFPFPRIKFLVDNDFTQIGHSEEHLIIKSDTPDVLKPGQILLAHPYHICPTVALYDQVQVVSKGHILEQWEVIARNRKITI